MCCIITTNSKNSSNNFYSLKFSLALHSNYLTSLSGHCMLWLYFKLLETTVIIKHIMSA